MVTYTCSRSGRRPKIIGPHHDIDTVPVNGIPRFPAFWLHIRLSWCTLCNPQIFGVGYGRCTICADHGPEMRWISATVAIEWFNNPREIGLVRAVRRSTQPEIIYGSNFSRRQFLGCGFLYPPTAYSLEDLATKRLHSGSFCVSDVTARSCLIFSLNWGKTLYILLLTELDVCICWKYLIH